MVWVYIKIKISEEISTVRIIDLESVAKFFTQNIVLIREYYDAISSALSANLWARYAGKGYQ